jgi:hypothetical protein
MRGVKIMMYVLKSKFIRDYENDYEVLGMGSLEDIFKCLETEEVNASHLKLQNTEYKILCLGRKRDD